MSSNDVGLFFLVVGRSVLSYLGVTMHAFAISGGVLLFATALPTLFGQRGSLHARERSERPTAGEDIAIRSWRYRCSQARVLSQLSYCLLPKQAVTPAA